jgi:hypothetical protein
MENSARDCAKPDQIQPGFAQRLLKPIARRLCTGDPHATLDRLFSSKHVKDLQLIIAGALVSVYVAFFISLVIWIVTIVAGNAGKMSATHDLLTFMASVLAVFGAVLTWAYQAGSARLGVVDLFACEISTLCRVTTVIETVPRLVDRFKQGPPTETAAAIGSRSTAASHFSSQENYFPVFESNSRHLQTLEAKVVINITAFYTFMKAFRDSLRTLAEISPQLADFETSNGASTAGSWHQAARNVVYMLFLGLESARHAINDLVEFEPEEAERTIVILFSELEAYGFLLSQFTDENDVFHKRLMLRLPEYQQLVPKLRRCVEASRAKESPKPGPWDQAWLLLPDLNRRFQDAVSMNP